MVIGIIGLGLMGGSIAKSLKSKGLCNKIIAYDTDRSALVKAYDQKIIDCYTEHPDASFKVCDIIFVCTPVNLIIPTILELQDHIKDSCILTDIGSTKKQIIKDINQTPIKNRFIGGHPMAGSEKKGYDYSSEIMLENAFYILTPTKYTDEKSILILSDLIRSIGAIVLITDPDTHDRVTAAVSHVPHVVAGALVNLVQQSDTDQRLMHMLAAGGFRDITRIASSSPSIWQSICSSNKEHIMELLDSYQNELNSFKKALYENDYLKVYNFFENAKKYRDSFEFRTVGIIQPVFEFSVSVKDRPGIIASISMILAENNINIKNIGIVNNREGFEGVLRIEFYDHDSMDKAFSVLRSMDYKVYDIK